MLQQRLVLRPADAESCQVSHVGYAVSGAIMVFCLSDGMH